MRMEALILAALLPFLTAGTCCFPPPKKAPFALDRPVTEADVTAVIGSAPDMQRGELECRWICREVYQREASWHALVDDCTMTIQPEPGATPDSVIGRVKCYGTAYSYACKGRRPLGHVEWTGEDDGLRGYFARCAHLEAASVAAFVELAEWLTAVGGPRALALRCVAAAEDERRHAAAFAGLVRELGGVTARVERRPEERALLAVALHNAVEGCVYEAWAAVEAAWQATHASDARVRGLLAVIAGEEARHAELAWDLHAWLLGQLDERGRELVRARQAAALAGLPRVAAQQVCPPELGMPEAAVVEAIARRFADGLAAAA